MRPDQEMALVSGGDCTSHWHSEDRKPTQALLQGLQNIQKVLSATASYAASLDVDYNLIDTTVGVVSVTLPKARGNRVLVFTRTAGTNNIVLSPQLPDTVNGGTSLVITTSHAPVRLLALAGVGYEQV